MPALAETFALGVMAGLSGVMFPGPVVVYVMQQSLARGFRAGFSAIVAHALVGLAVLILIITTGITALFGSPAFHAYVGLVGGASLIILGALLALHARDCDGAVRPGDGVPPHAGRPFIGSLLVSVSNPQFFLWWAVIGLPNVALAHDLSGMWGVCAWTAGILAAIFSWYGAIALLASRGKQHLPAGIVRAVSLLSGAFLVIFGVCLLALYGIHLP
jgi:threonine/homoserine/homoserine lactone efflux protein